MTSKIVCIAQVHNELRKGNLERFLSHVLPLVDSLVVYDDGSTDGSYEFLLQKTQHIIRSAKNDFTNEIAHKQKLLERALELSPDFILWLDADEVLTVTDRACLQELCDYCVEHDLDGIALKELNIWRSHTWRRLDSLFDEGWFTRLWRVKQGLDFGKPEAGLHKRVTPPSIQKVERVQHVAVLHYGFASERSLAHKYLVYKSQGQSGYIMLDRLIDEEHLEVERIPRSTFPPDLWKEDDPRPEALTFERALAYVEHYRHEVFDPAFSIICLTYRSVEWARFVYDQVLKYTDLSSGEFFFVANDASEDVTRLLRDHYIPHFEFHNPVPPGVEWYINRVYRAYNFGAARARGDFLVFINSDMAFMPGWLDELWRAYDGANCISSRLVESGKMPSGQYGIENSFGSVPGDYREEEFIRFARALARRRVADGGLYMPLFIRKDHFLAVGGYPEGNIVPGSDLFNPVLAKEGEPCVSGDRVLMKKLATRGIRHQTAFASVVYHFQLGESGGKLSEKPTDPALLVAVCNDLLTGSMGEKVLWDYLLEGLPSSVGVDAKTVGDAQDFARACDRYLRASHPRVPVIIQNATFMGLVDPAKYTIAFLQDDLRAMGADTRQQEFILTHVQKLVTNSTATASSYREFDFEIIPIGVNHDLFRPQDKSEVRHKHGFSANERIGIFVGSYSEVKGWSSVEACIRRFPDITWILVSKYADRSPQLSGSIRLYARIPQPLLAELLNCADFFILGSPVETQCLAALEACLCDIPVVMPRVGIFRSFTEDELSRIGVFGNDLESGVEIVLERKFTPRQVIIDKGLTIEATVERWRELLTNAMQHVANTRGRFASPEGIAKYRVNAGLARLRFQMQLYATSLGTLKSSLRSRLRDIPLLRSVYRSAIKAAKSVMKIR